MADKCNSRVGIFACAEATVVNDRDISKMRMHKFTLQLKAKRKIGFGLAKKAQKIE